MPPKKVEEGRKDKCIAEATSHSSPPSTEESPTSLLPTSPPQIIFGSRPIDIDSPSQPAMVDSAEEASNLGKDAPKTPEKTAGEDGESPFRALREELGLARVATPALRPRRSTDPFVLRLRPEMVRSEENLMTLALTPAEATAVRDRQAAQVLSQCMDETLTLKEALWYLEWADWNVELAILQQMHDHIDRNEAPKTGSIQMLADFPEENPNLDRDPAIAGDAFSESKLKLHYKQYGIARTRTYPLWQIFDRKSIKDIRALNMWRWKLIVEQVGLKNLSKSKMKGWTYNKLELIWIRNYERDHPDPVGRDITEAFNATFTGAMLPGEVEPRGERSAAAIASIRRRIAEAREKKGSGKKRTAFEAELDSVEEKGNGSGVEEAGSIEGDPNDGGTKENEEGEDKNADEAGMKDAEEKEEKEQDEADGVVDGDSKY